MRPMKPREILQLAYVHGLVPRHLHGKTQHKTLTARLSTDILRYKERSKFFDHGQADFSLRNLSLMNLCQ